MENYDPIDFNSEAPTQGNRVDHGGPAFPRSAAEHSQGGHYEQDGMTLRDYFAAKALNGLLAADEECGFNPDVAAECAYRFADAMIAAREGGAS